MKLLMKRAFTVVLAAVLLFGCGEDNNKTGGNELTPQENKAKLEQCAMGRLRVKVSNLIRWE